MNQINSILLCFLLVIATLSSCKSSKKISHPISTNKTTINTIGDIGSPTTTKEGSKTMTFTPGAKDIKMPDMPPLPPYDFKEEQTIKKIQIALYLSGYAPGKVNGLWTELTDQALTKFQQNHNIPVGDRTDPTIRALGIQHLDFSIETIQQSLQQKGFDAGPIDGLMGSMTRGAYIDFLTQNGLETTEGITKEIKTALLSKDPRYNNKEKLDALFDTKNDNFATINGAHKSVLLTNATVTDVQTALAAWGYDPGPTSEVLTAPTADALFRYQVDKALPIGGFNKETLRALGFKD